MIRNDGRRPRELRPVIIVPGYLEQAEGSALIDMGETRVLCAVTVEDRLPRFAIGSGAGWITAEYGMLPRSTHTRTPRERSSSSGRTAEIQRLIGRSLRSVTKLDLLGARTAAITGAYVALAQAVHKLIQAEKMRAFPLRCAVAAVSAGILDGMPLLDLNYEEDFRAAADFNIVMTGARAGSAPAPCAPRSRPRGPCLATVPPASCAPSESPAASQAPTSAGCGRPPHHCPRTGCPQARDGRRSRRRCTHTAWQFDGHSMHRRSPPAISRCYPHPMADVRPFRALRYAPSLDLAAAISPPFDIISPEQQRALHERSPYNAVHIELAMDNGGRYQQAAQTLDRWRADGTLLRDDAHGFYLHDHQYEHDGIPYRRRLIFARLRLERWDRGIVLPHEQTFGAPKEDRLRLLRAIHTNTSPVFLIYRDHDRQVEALLDRPAAGAAIAEFSGDDDQTHTLRRIDDPRTTEALTSAFELETLYIADGHHRYETALGYRDERRAAATDWSGEEPENFVLVALASAGDPGLPILPIHRVTAAGVPPREALSRIEPLFSVERPPSLEALVSRLTAASQGSHAFGLVSAESDEPYLLTVSDPKAVDALLPQDRSAAWRALDYAIANHVILRHALGLEEAQMSDYGALWFTEDAAEAARDARGGRARYAVLMNPVPITRVLDVADSGERMPQKSTFFYPKVPTGLVFNPLEE